jgi:hypothetical protein
MSGQKIHAQVDGEKREVRLTVRRELDIHPFVVALPFDYMKSLHIKILEIEVAVEREAKERARTIVAAEDVQ